jgi:hypothetical protein
MPETIDEKGNPVLIEAVYYRYHAPYAEECPTIEAALRYLESGEDYGELSSVGVFVEGECVRHRYHDEPPTAEQAAEALEKYRKLKARE